MIFCFVSTLMVWFVHVCLCVCIHTYTHMSIYMCVCMSAVPQFLCIQLHFPQILYVCVCILYLCVCVWLWLAFRCAWAFSLCSLQGLLFVAVCGLLTAVASGAGEHRLQAHGLHQLQHGGAVVAARGLQSVGSVVVAPRLQLFCGMWDPPRAGIKPTSPALAGGF